MIVCPKCGKELADGTKFCSKCGTPVSSLQATAEAEVKKEEPAKTPEAEAKKEEPAKAPVAEVKKEEPAKAPVAEVKKEEPAKAPVAEAKQEEPAKASNKALKWIGIVAAAVVLLILICSIFFGKKGEKHYALYLKDKEISYTNLTAKGSWQVTSKLCKEGDMDNADLIRRYGIYDITLSKDGKLLFFPDKMEYSDDGTTLYYRNVNKPKKDASKMDSSVRNYYVNEASNLVTYLKTSDDLYQYNIKKEDKEKIASEVSDYRVSDDGSKVVYRKSSGEIYLWTKKDNEKLDSDTQRLSYVSEDFKTVYYLKDGSLYKKSGSKDKEKIASEVSRVLRIYDSGEVYYVKEDSDSNALFYYSGKDSEKVADYFVSYYATASKAAVIAYSAKESERSEKPGYYVAVKQNVSELDQTDARYFLMDEDGKFFYFVADLNRDGDEGELYRASVSGSKVGKVEKYDTDVSTEYMTLNESKQIIYFKDVRKSKGDFFCDKKKVDSDVYVYSAQYCKNTKEFLYFVDYSDSKGIGTLKIGKAGGKARKIADDVAQNVMLSNGTVLYLADYSTKYYKGELYLYKNKKSIKLDDEVSRILTAN